MSHTFKVNTHTCRLSTHHVGLKDDFQGVARCRVNSVFNIRIVDFRRIRSCLRQLFQQGKVRFFVATSSRSLFYEACRFHDSEVIQVCSESLQMSADNFINLKLIDGLVQDCSISSSLAMAILQSCTKPSNYFVQFASNNRCVYLLW